MRLTLIGGTGPVGIAATRVAIGAGHDVVVAHSGEHEPAEHIGARHIHGKREELLSPEGPLARSGADVLVDTRTTAENAASVVACAQAAGARRLIVLSSSDVYVGSAMPHASPVMGPSNTAGGRPPWLGRALALCLTTLVLSIVLLGWSRLFRPEGIDAHLPTLTVAFLLGAFVSALLDTRAAPVLGGLFAGLMCLGALVINVVFLLRGETLLLNGPEALIIGLGLCAAAGVIGGFVGVLGRGLTERLQR